MKYKILIIDDNSDVRHAAREFLTMKGFDVLTAPCGKDGLELQKKEKADLLLLDIQLPDMSGIDILTEAKKIYPESIVIMISCLGDANVAVEALKKGADDYMNKPYNFDHLLKLIHKLLRAKGSTKSGAIRESSRPQSTDISPVKNESDANLKKGRRFYTYAGIISAVLIAGAIIAVYTYFNARLNTKVFSVPYSNPSAITFDGQHLWVSDPATQSFYQHITDDNFSLVKTYYIRDSNPAGITFDGEYLLSSNAEKSVIFKHRLDASLTVLETFKMPTRKPSILYWDGAYLWICDRSTRHIVQAKITEDGLLTLRTFDFPCDDPAGIVYDGEHFWIGDRDTNQIYRSNKDFTVHEIYSVPQLTLNNGRLSAMTWDYKSLWLCDSKNQMVYNIQFKNLHKKE